MKSLSTLGLLALLFSGFTLQAQRIVVDRSGAVQESPAPQGELDESWTPHITVATSYSEYFAGVIPVFLGVEFTDYYTLELGAGITRKAVVGHALLNVLSLGGGYERDYSPRVAFYLRNKFYSPELKMYPFRNLRFVAQAGVSYKRWNYRDEDQINLQNGVTADWTSATFTIGFNRSIGNGFYMESSYGLSWTTRSAVKSQVGQEDVQEYEQIWLPSVHLSAGYRF